MRPPEDATQDLLRQWLTKAEEDFAVAEHLLSENTPYLGTVGFHAQQASEKFLKAVLVHYQVEFPKTHDLGRLLDLVATANAPLAASLRGATALNPLGATMRYPSDLPELTAEDARTAVGLAASVREAVRALLGDRAGGR
jgi:HEPN domain-containing protein